MQIWFVCTGRIERREDTMNKKLLIGLLDCLLVALLMVSSYLDGYKYGLEKAESEKNNMSN